MDIRLPELGENIEGGDVIKILVKPGDTVTLNQALIEVETDKAAIEVPAPQAGKVESVKLKLGDHVKVGDVIVTLSGAGAAASVTTAAPAPVKSNTTITPPPHQPAPKVMSPAYAPTVSRLPSDIPAAPSVRRRARELGIDLSKIIGTGLDGRLQMRDLEAGGTAAVQLLNLPDFSKWGEVTYTPLSKVRRLTAERLMQSWPQVPQVTHFDKADITLLEERRRAHNAKAEKTSAKITATALLLKACADALKQFPQFNASIDLKNDRLIEKRYINIGVAVDTDRGLLVPVIRLADQKNVAQLADELDKMAQKARLKKIVPDEMQGGNFTISNLGGIGGTQFTPIVNAPDAAILGVSRSQYEPVYDGKGGFNARLFMPLALSYDHRLIDGADAARFLRWLAERLEKPDWFV